MVQGREQLAAPAQAAVRAHVPHVNAVVAVDAGQPAAGGVVGQRHRVGEPAPWFAGEQLTGERDKGHLGCHGNAPESIQLLADGGGACGAWLRAVWETLPGIHQPNVGPQAVWAGQRAAEVQVNGAERSNGPVRTSTEDQVLRQGQTGGLGHLGTDAAQGQRSPADR